MQALKSLYAQVLIGIALPNDASVGFHEALGFENLGVYKDVGFKPGLRRDVGWRRLGLAAGLGPTAEPILFARFRDTSAFRAVLG